MVFFTKFGAASMLVYQMSTLINRYGLVGALLPALDKLLPVSLLTAPIVE